MKILENLWQSSENFWKRSKMVLNFWENLRELVYGNFWKTSETVQKCSSEIFGSVRNFSGIFGKLQKWFKKIFFRCFYYFLKFSENEVFENHRKSSGCDRKSKCLVGVKTFGASF